MWFPETLNLKLLHQKNKNNPDPDFDYAAAFATLDLDQVKKDIHKALTTSQDWWPADYGHYGGFFIRQAWHQAGTYRVFDGRGGASTGNQRFSPLNSWPDNANLDKARRLLWPVKQKYGRKLSWADLFMLTGNQALEEFGLKPFGFGGGRVDIYAPEEDIYWGPETEMLGDERHKEAGDINDPLGASVQGLIYVNPEGHQGIPDPEMAAKEIRTTFGNMAMNDYETVALIAGGHTVGKSHGVAPDSDLGPPPEAAPLEDQQFGYASPHGTGVGKDTVTSGIEGAWTTNPVKFDTGYFDNLFKYEWECIKGPGGKYQWQPKGEVKEMVPDAHVKGKMHKPMMMTTDIALIKDPKYLEISQRFHENHDEFVDAFAKAWYKLTHRDMGPTTRLVGKDVPEPQIWQDPIPPCHHTLIDDTDIAALKKQIMGSGTGIKAKLLGRSGPTIAQLVRTAWASAATFRCTDYRGGANGARIRFAPQKNWAVNKPEELEEMLKYYENIQETFNKAQASGDKRVSLADLIVLGGCAAIEEAAKKAGHNIKVPFTPGRMDATLEETDVDSFAPLEPTSDGFRNYLGESNGKRYKRSAEEMLVDRAHLLGLSAPEMTVLVGGMRALAATNTPTAGTGIFSSKPETLTNDFFVNLLDMATVWKKLDDNTYEGRDRKSDKVKWTASRVDLIFGSHSELRAIAEFYAGGDTESKFVEDFVAAWTKVMNADMYAQS